MKEVITVELINIRFFAFHGLYELEQKTGTDFIVDLKVKYVPGSTEITIDETINYETLFELVKSKMEVPEKLLETLTKNIANSIYEQFPFTKEINIRIEKINPPIENMCGNVAVSYRQKF